MTRLTRDSRIAICLIVIALVALWESRDLNLMSAVFPRTAGGILLILSLVYLVKSLVKPEFGRVLDAIDRRRVMQMCVGLILYVFLIWFIGFLAASLIFLAYFVWYLQGAEQPSRRRMLRAGAASLVISGGFYLLFKMVFVVPLPVGYLFGG
ncbi:MAG: tripartite tricarboxylate transporter TctB family protein [Bacillaceae bacterium]|nr:tripartite tricarboxylate transporter TctB family protein [Bacillaceae bacterium]